VRPTLPWVKADANHRTHARYCGRYFRSLTLPYPVKEGEISATFDGGVLELRPPEAEEVKVKKIEIKAQIPEVKPKSDKPKKRVNVRCSVSEGLRFISPPRLFWHASKRQHITMFLQLCL
jgi:hypothetical protein